MLVETWMISFWDFGKPIIDPSTTIEPINVSYFSNPSIAVAKKT